MRALVTSSSYPLGSIRGIPVRLHSLYLIFLAAQVFGASGGRSALQAVYWALLLGPILLLTVLAHELAHCLAARSVGVEAHSILLWPLGGLAFMGRAPSPKADMWVAVAGPLSHIPMTAAWLLLLHAAHWATLGSWALGASLGALMNPSHLAVALCAGAVVLNVALMLFNLCLPAYPLDGGHLLADALLMAGLRPLTAAWVTAAVAAPLGAGVLAWGVISWHPATALVGSWVLWSTWCLAWGAWRGDLSAHPLFSSAARSEAGRRGGYVLVDEEEGDGYTHPAHAAV